MKEMGWMFQPHGDARLPHPKKELARLEVLGHPLSQAKVLDQDASDGGGYNRSKNKVVRMKMDAPAKMKTNSSHTNILTNLIFCK
jgi:hypothetical protein